MKSVSVNISSHQISAHIKLLLLSELSMTGLTLFPLYIILSVLFNMGTRGIFTWSSLTLGLVSAVVLLEMLPGVLEASVYRCLCP